MKSLKISGTFDFLPDFVPDFALELERASKKSVQKALHQRRIIKEINQALMKKKKV